MNQEKRHARPAVLMLETMASIVMILFLVAALTWSLVEYSRHSERVRTRGQALAAAESVLNEIRAGVREDVGARPGRFKGFGVEAVRTPGEGDWKEMTLVAVKVAEVREDGGMQPLAELSGYVLEAVP